MRRFLLFSIIPLLLTGGCVSASETTEPRGEKPAAAAALEKNDMLRFNGKVVHVPVEGGFYGILAEDGTKYDPRNLPEEFRKDGLAVKVTARPLEGVVGFHMWGRIIDIVTIEKR